MTLREKIKKCAEESVPECVKKIEYHKSERSGRATFTKYGEWVMEMRVPKPVSIPTLYIFLHECAHFALEHWRKRTPVYIQEFEAVVWALRKMREYGIEYQNELIQKEAKYVANKLELAKKRGLKNTDKRVVKWLKIWGCYDEAGRQQDNQPET